MQLKPTKTPPPQEGHDEGNWLISYADLMTLLCGFFILLLSMARIDEAEYSKLKDEVAKHFDEAYIPPKNRLEESILAQIKALGIEKYARITTDSNQVVLQFQSGIFFETGSSLVSSNGSAILRQVIGKISHFQQEENKTFFVAVEGHTDARPMASTSGMTNWELSGARASSVVRMFVQEKFPADHLAALGYAETHPAVPPSGPNNTWTQADHDTNRRVVIRILEPGLTAIPLPEEAKSEETSPQIPEVHFSTLPLSSPTPR
jgi:chemotaxis protein MotB